MTPEKPGSPQISFHGVPPGKLYQKPTLSLLELKHQEEKKKRKNTYSTDLIADKVRRKRITPFHHAHFLNTEYH